MASFIILSLWESTTSVLKTGRGLSRWRPLKSSLLASFSPSKLIKQLDPFYKMMLHAQVCSVDQHANYNSATTDYDFAVLRLCEELSFQVATTPLQRDIRPACLPSSFLDDYDDHDVREL